MPRLRAYKWDAMGRDGYAAWKRDRPTAVAFDTETTGLTWHDEPFCVTVAWDNESHFFDLEYTDKNWDRVASLLSHTQILIGHNLKFDLQKLILVDLLDRKALEPSTVEDTLLMAHLLDEQRSNKLKDLAKSVLGVTTQEDEVLTKVRAQLKINKEVGYLPIYQERPGVIVPYAIKDAEFTWQLYKRFPAKLARFPEMENLYRLEMEGLLGILDMEARGLGVDVAYVKDKIKEYGGKILATERGIADVVGKPVKTGKMTAQEKRECFNPASQPQKKQVMLERGFDLPNMQEKTLSKIDDPLAQLLIDLAKLTKIRSTYLINIRDETRDGIIHPNFKQNVRTGRMASGKEEG